MRPFAALFLLLASGFSLAEPVVHQPTGISFPDEIAGFARDEVTNYESKHAGFGFSYGYNLRSRIAATVYVYSAGQCPVPSGIDGPAITRMREQTLAEIRQAYESVEPVTRETARFAGEKDEIPVLYDLLKLQADGRPRVSTVWLWAARDHFIKIRISASSLDDLDKMREFAAAVARLAEAKPDTGKRKAPAWTLRVDGSLTESRRLAWMAYGLGIMTWIMKCTSVETASPGPLQLSFAAEQYARRKQTEVWRDVGRRSDPVPYAEELIKVEDAGYLDDYLWRYLRRPAWGPVPQAVSARGDEFERWMAQNLPKHSPETRAGIVVPRK